MKQTAVEWLLENLPSLLQDDSGHYQKLFQQALAMEKEQITYCYDFVSSKICTQCDDFKTGEQYYNETYGN